MNEESESAPTLGTLDSANVDYEDDPVMNVLLAQSYEASHKGNGTREDEDMQRAIELSLLGQTPTAQSCELSSSSSTSNKVDQDNMGAKFDPTWFDQLLAEQEQVREGFDQAQVSINLPAKSETFEKPSPPEVIVLTEGGIFEQIAYPGQYFDAAWDLRIKDSGGRAEWSKDGVSLQPWGSRAFVPDDCALGCTHQVKIELNSIIARDEDDGTQTNKSPSVDSLRRRGTIKSSAVRDGWRNIRLKRLHLRAPLTEGYYEEIWRLRYRALTQDRCSATADEHRLGFPFGDLFIIRVKVDATKPRSALSDTISPNILSNLQLRYSLISQGTRYSSKDQSLTVPEVPAKEFYDYIWVLRNDGNEEWPTGLKISRLQDESESTATLSSKGKERSVEPGLVVTDERRRFLCVPLKVGATARVLLSRRKAPAIQGVHEERWRLSVKIGKTEIDIGEPLTLRIKVVESSSVRAESPPPTFEEATKAYPSNSSNDETDEWVLPEFEESPSEVATDEFSLISSRRSSFEIVERESIERISPSMS